MPIRPEPPDFEDDETLVDRSVSFVREMSARLRERARRRWRTTSLGVDVGILRRRRRQWLLVLGDRVYAGWRAGRRPDTADLEESFAEIRALEQAIAAKEAELAELEEDEIAARDEDDRMAAPPLAGREHTRRLARRPPAPPAPPVAADAELGDDGEPPSGVG